MKTPWLESLFNKKKPQHRSFPLNFAEFLKTTFSQNISGQLLLITISLAYPTYSGSIYEQHPTYVINRTNQSSNSPAESFRSPNQILKRQGNSTRFT